jgi:hypothetical protein
MTAADIKFAALTERRYSKAVPRNWNGFLIETVSKRNLPKVGQAHGFATADRQEPRVVWKSLLRYKTRR